ncbi:MAG: tRNA (adenosine(37)-N6)-threonylcarbamoyltransferase complex transferase subunit TsaD [Candidatus Staskawiczbacteria bacterium]|nr:tRNA (adenosine(37)-N6)-threonylcarbamoyltransferase complex transferase subunit TsaD [Candidatus Staskawiczbacteria bacterium]
MKILAIETSCDDTGIAILEAKNKKFTVLSNIVSSQQIHINYGGVFPIMAKREHQNNLVPTLIEALGAAKILKNKKITLTDKQINTLKTILEKESRLYEFTKEFLETYEKPKVDYIAVTHGPGLEPCLWVGVNFTKALSYFWDIPVIPVNHIEAHILVNFLENPKIKFPAISLIVSGGHTQLILVKGVGKYTIIGETRDDAAGECFDKAARILGLAYPGGPIISKIASQIRESSITLPRPMMHSKDYDFSFSGLKTSVLYKLRDTNPKIAKSEKFIQEMAFAIQDAICDVLIKKTLNAAKDYKAKTIILGGGVSANQELRKQFKVKSEIPVIFPEPKLSTDNGLMIAVAGYFNRAKKIGWQRLSVHPNLRV